MPPTILGHECAVHVYDLDMDIPEYALIIRGLVVFKGFRPSPTLILISGDSFISTNFCQPIHFKIHELAIA